MLLKVPTYLALNLNGSMHGQPVYKGKIHRYCGIITPSMIFAYMNNEHFFSLNGDGPPDTPVERFWLAASQNMPERSQLIVDCTYRGKAASLFVVLEVAHYLRELGRPEEALATLEAANPEGPLAAAFADLGEQRNWWWDGIARTYQMLGRYDEAVAAFRKGIDANENGSLNVSQTINLGHAHLRFGHPVDALASAAAFDSGKYSASPYGEMELRLVRGCALLALKRSVEAKAQLT
ncbi:MAG: hypothetical protein EOO68_12580, partial [Moraxellaceae bacterium]